MRIQHNIMAMNAYRNYTSNTSALSKNLEKLSSGYKINRAGDDAAGLAISEKMRAQITGLQTAQKNAKDGISLIQTAEGALTEVHDMLNRMVQLADQSANGTYDNDVDRANLQKEFDALKTEIDRIADATNFNGIKLLDGSMGVGASAISDVQINSFTKAGVSDAFKATFGNDRPDAVTTQQSAIFSVKLDDVKFSAGGASADAHSFTLKINGETVATVTGAGNAALTGSGLANKIDGAGFELKADGTLGTAAGAYTEIDGNIYKMEASGDTITFTQVNKMAAGSPNVNPDYKVEISGTADRAESAGFSGTVNSQVQKTQTGIAVGGTEQAHVNVDIDFTKIKDGDSMKVGDKTYVFKIGENSTAVTSGAGDKFVDLTKIFKSADDLKDAGKQAQAMTAIVSAMGASGSAEWSAGNGGVNRNVGTITFQSLSTYADAPNGDKMDTEKNVMKQFEFTTPAKDASASFNVDVSKIKVGDTFTIRDKTYEFTNGANASKEGNIAINLSAYGIADGITASNEANVMNAIKTAIDGDKFTGTAQTKYTTTVDGNTISMTANDWAATTLSTEKENKWDITVKSDNGLILQIGDTAESFNQLKVSVSDMHVKAMGLSDVNIANQTSAKAAVDAIKSAVNYVSSTRGDLGALQNRLEHTINNLSVTTENIQDAESSIRDVDVAEEMMAYTKNNILVQSAQAMLAQANQIPQGVLQLLQ